VWNFSTISPLKFDLFLKNHIYSERGAHGASSYAKNSISIFFEKSGFLKGGGLINYLQGGPKVTRQSLIANKF
jgi:hypothetical protein